MAVGFPCPTCGSDREASILHMEKSGAVVLLCMTCERRWGEPGIDDPIDD